MYKWLTCVLSAMSAEIYMALQGILLCCSSAACKPGLLRTSEPFQCGCHCTALDPLCLMSIVAVRILASSGDTSALVPNLAMRCRRASLIIKAAATACTAEPLYKAA